MTLTELLLQLEQLHPKKIDLSLGRMQALLARLGNPEMRMPPTIHVAGTNGKGSTIAFMRAIAESAGLRAHVYTSPHLVRFNERIVLAGHEVTDDVLAAALQHVLAVNDGAPITFFESTTAAAFWLFAQYPADLLLLEVGLGGRLDATNVLIPAVTAITPISMDHVEFLGDTLEKIAFEKAGIMKPGVPCVVAPQAPEVMNVLQAQAEAVRCKIIKVQPCLQKNTISLLGLHQQTNAAAAIECMQQLQHPLITNGAIDQGLQNAHWPGRLERITRGALYESLSAATQLWFDGAHNEAGAIALGTQLKQWKQEQPQRPIHLYLAMLRNRDPVIFIKHLLPYIDSIICCDMPDQPNAWHADELQSSIKTIAPDLDCYTELDGWEKNKGDTQSILIAAGSLYFYAQIVKN